MAAKGKIPRTVILLGLVSLFTDSASEMIYPLIPVFVATLGSGAVVLGIMEGLAETTASVLKLFSGTVSDRLGKRKALVTAGYSISSLVRPLMGLAGAAWHVVAIRMADRVGKGIRAAPRDALIASSVDESMRGRAYGFHRAMDHTGAVIGPVLAIITLLFLITVAGISEPGKVLRHTFLMAFIPGIIAVLILVFLVRERQSPADRSKRLSLNLRSLDPNFRKYLLVMVLFTLGNSSDAFLLFRVQEVIGDSTILSRISGTIPALDRIVAGFDDQNLGKEIASILFLPFLWAYFHLIKALFSVPLGALSDRIGRKITINTGWAVYAFVYFMFSILNFLPSRLQIQASLVLFGIYALYYAFSEGAQKAFVADLVPEEKRGTAFGLFNFAIGIGTLPSSVLFGLIYSYSGKLFPGYGGTIAFGFGSVLALLSIILLAATVREPARQK